MPSPFPGMNPYIEQDVFWQDFHLEFLPAIRGRLVAQVRPKYIVMLDEHIYVQEHPPEPRRQVGRADLSVAAAPARPGADATTGVGVLEAPVQIKIPTQDVRRVPFLEVRDRLGRDLITVVELLSPANKRGGADPEQYVARRESLLKSTAHFVEIDLLRGGRPMPLENRPRCDYSVLVSRAEARPWAGFWPIRMRKRLPIIPIPLLPGDPDARIDLQEILNHVYDATGYDDFIYAGRPDPRLSSKDDAWARSFVPPTP
jgi:Protein of unknown function (DUF4058)